MHIPLNNPGSFETNPTYLCKLERYNIAVWFSSCQTTQQDPQHFITVTLLEGLCFHRPHILNKVRSKVYSPAIQTFTSVLNKDQSL